MSGGGKGGKQETEIKLPKSLEKGANALIDRAMDVSRQGFQPNRAGQIAAFTPMQQQAMQQQMNRSQAWGMGGGNAMAGIPKPDRDTGGIASYSIMPGYREAMQRTPQGYKDYIDSFFINPGKRGAGAGGVANNRNANNTMSNGKGTPIIGADGKQVVKDGQPRVSIGNGIIGMSQRDANKLYGGLK